MKFIKPLITSISIFFIMFAPLYADYSRKILGDNDAPVIMYKFISLSCVHCVTFHTKIMPDIKRKYIDNGLLKVIFIDVPFGSNANLFAHSLLYQTRTNEDFFKLASIILKDQNKWISSQNPIQSLTAYARLFGLNEDAIKRASGQSALQQWLQDDSKKLMQETAIRGTPAVILTKNGESIYSSKVKFEGLTSYKDIEKAINKLLS